MKKYDPLTEYLENCGQASIILSYAEIEKIIGDSLPPSATDWPAWWANDRTQKSRHSSAWLDAGYETSDVKLGQSVTFEKVPK